MERRKSMSNGHDVKPAEVITVDQDEFNEVLKRVHRLLISRADKAKDKNIAHPTALNDAKHIEAVKDVFALVHMMELVEYMSEEIADLREMLTLEGKLVEDETGSTPEMFSQSKAKFIN
jgi:hypothetical protein